MIALCHGQLYQSRLKKTFDKKVRPREFQEGDLVLKTILPIHKDSRGMWTPNYEGPYVVKKAFSRGALILTTMDGENFPLPVNSDAVKKYYAYNKRTPAKLKTRKGDLGKKKGHPGGLKTRKSGPGKS
jgi:hypothetical protein